MEKYSKNSNNQKITNRKSEDFLEKHMNQLENEFNLQTNEKSEEKLISKKEKISDDDVFIVDLGTDTVKYGWLSNENPCVMKNSVETTGMMNVDKRPINSADFDFVNGNEYVGDLIRRVLKVGGYKSSHPLVVLLSVPLDKEAPSDITNKFFESEYTSEPPANFFIGYSPQLAAFGASNDLEPTAIVVDSGASKTTVLPLYCGSVISHAIEVINFGGDDVIQLINRAHGSKKGTRVPKHIHKAIKESFYVSTNFEQEMVQNGFVVSPQKQSQSIAGFDKKNPALEKKLTSFSLEFGVERFAAPEAFFRPSLLNKVPPYKAIDEVILDCIRKFPPQLHQNFLKKIILVGQNTKFKGLKERLKNQLQFKVPQFPVFVYQGSDYCAWKGAALFASHPNFLNECTDPQQFPSIIFNYKFF